MTLRGQDESYCARTPERRRLLVEHRLDSQPRGFQIEAVLCHQVAAIGQDGVGVLHHLQPLEAVVVVQPHAEADDLVHVHDAERPVALVRAQFAVIGMIDRDQRVDARRGRRRKLVLLQFAAVGRQHADAVGLQGDRRLDADRPARCRHGAQNVLGRLDHPGNAGMSMQRDPHRHARAQQRLEPVEAPAQEQRERRHFERFCAAHFLDGRQRRLGELHLARSGTTTAPGRFCCAQLVERSSARPEAATSPVRISRCRSNGSARL